MLPEKPAKKVAKEELARMNLVYSSLSKLRLKKYWFKTITNITPPPTPKRPAIKPPNKPAPKKINQSNTGANLQGQAPYRILFCLLKAKWPCLYLYHLPKRLLPYLHYNDT